MDKLFRLAGAQRHQVAVDEWLFGEPDALYAIARHWFAQMRKCGEDVHELLHDGCPVACVHDAAFAYVNVFSTHVNVGFFAGSELDDPHHLLEGSGQRMRHVKIHPEHKPDSQQLDRLVRQAYMNIKNTLGHR